MVLVDDAEAGDDDEDAPGDVITSSFEGALHCRAFLWVGYPGRAPQQCVC